MIFGEIEQALMASFEEDKNSSSETDSDFDAVNYLSLGEDQLIGRRMKYTSRILHLCM